MPDYLRLFPAEFPAEFSAEAVVPTEALADN
jgi:hypothetical protein